MTELVTADTNKNEAAAFTIQVPPYLGSGTYVVQVPKDQIYRIPPPENALIVQRLNKPEDSRNSSCGISRFCCLIVSAVLIVLIAIAIGLSVFIIKNKPKNPVFQLRQVGVKNQFHHPLTAKNSHPEFRIGLGIENPNAYSGISYKQGGLTALSFKEKKIASGNFPGFDQGKGNSQDVVILLKGSSGAGLPKEIKNSISPPTNAKKEKKNKNHISMSLSMEIPVKMKINPFRTGDAKLVVTCDFEVDTLAKSTHILSQHCKTDRS